MYSALMPGAIGIRDLTLTDSIALAADAGFKGVTFSVKEAKELADQHGIDHVKNLFDERGITPACWSPPVAWLNDEQRDADLAALPAFAEVAVGIGCPRATSGIMPGHDERDFDAQFAYVAERLKPFAEVLQASGVRLGLEFIAPKTLRNRYKYEFVYSLQGMLGLARTTGTNNVGVLFDAWHHYTAHGTIDELDDLKASDVVVVHVNDAPPGIPIDEQIDNQRLLPMESGVIDVPEMLRRLDKIGYDGPLIPEPFNKRINDIAANDPAAAARETAQTVDKLIQAAGLAS